uniref:Uncharacterized protein n=1 Tax=Aquila chrysaetos chrysaetos TaxID=223781 RepID=A0A663EY77_AQUCH
MAICHRQVELHSPTLKLLFFPRGVEGISVSLIFRCDLCWSFSFAPVSLHDCILPMGFRRKWGKSFTPAMILSCNHFYFKGKKNHNKVG